MKKELYIAPKVQEYEISSEGFLCSSPAGAGVLYDNSWTLTFTDDLDYEN